MKHLLKKAFLLLALVGGASSAWGDNVYEYTHTPSLNTDSYFTVAKGADAAGTFNVSITFDLHSGTSTTVTKAVKMESATTITFTTSTKSSTVYVGLYDRNGTGSSASNNQFKLDGTTYTASSATDAGSYEIVTISDVEAGTHTITRNSKEVEIYYVKVVETGSVMTQLSTPEISYVGSTGTVTIGSVANATKVTYTTDGSDPTASSDTYATPFVVEDGTVVKAIAIGDGESYSNSDVATETVNLTGITCATPVINSFNGTVAISTTTPNATIKYCLNNGSYNTYTRSFSLPSGATVKAYAERTGCTNSSEASQVVGVLPTNKTKTIYLDYGDFDDNNTNSATGKEGTDAEGYTLAITGKIDKNWSSNGVNITTPDGVKREFKLSNGAQNTLTIPTGVHVTKFRLYSIIMSADKSLICGWKEVGGTDYQTGDGDYKKTPMGSYNNIADYNTNPDVREYDIDQIGGTITFNNAGTQLSFVIALDILEDNTTITPANDWSTYVTPTKLDFSDVAGLKAYAATAAAAGTVTLEEVGAVPAGTPLMLVGTAGTEYTVPVAASASAPANNMFVAGDGTTEFDGTTYDYILYTDGKFYKIGSGTVAKNKAYLHCNVDPTSALGRSLTISYGDKLTGIDQVENVEVKSSLPVKRIVNGNLVIEKNGVSVNAAGAKLY